MNQVLLFLLMFPLSLKVCIDFMRAHLTLVIILTRLVLILILRLHAVEYGIALILMRQGMSLVSVHSGRGFTD